MDSHIGDAAPILHRMLLQTPCIVERVRPDVRWFGMGALQVGWQAGSAMESASLLEAHLRPTFPGRRNRRRCWGASVSECASPCGRLGATSRIVDLARQHVAVGVKRREPDAVWMEWKRAVGPCLARISRVTCARGSRALTRSLSYTNEIGRSPASCSVLVVTRLSKRELTVDVLPEALANDCRSAWVLTRRYPATTLPSPTTAPEASCDLDR